jgi:DNA-directed RNA polymerase I subunit RPA1
VTKAAYLNKFKFIAQNYKAFLEKYNPHAAASAIDCEKAMKQMKKAMKKPEKYDPAMTRLSPSTHLGAVSEKFHSDLRKVRCH